MQKFWLRFGFSAHGAGKKRLNRHHGVRVCEWLEPLPLTQTEEGGWRKGNTINPLELYSSELKVKHSQASWLRPRCEHFPQSSLP